MKTITVSIGRNVGRVRMHDEDWNDFQLDLRTALERLDVEPYFTGTGFGPWHDLDLLEESFTIVGGLPDEAPRVDLVHELSRLAFVYSQEAIALTIGDTLFATASAYETFGSTGGGAE